MQEKKILIVDDEDAIRTLFTTVLSQKGYTVFSARSGEHALELLRHEKVSVMFLDLNLPGINGIDLCKKIINQTPDTIAYAITGYVSSYNLSECKAAGFTDFFSKPISLKTLFNAADAAFEKQITHH